MTEETHNTPSAGWKTAQVYAMAAFCLVLGLALGYLFRGSESKGNTAASPTQQTATEAPGMGSGTQMPTLEQMKQMGDKQAEPLLAQLKNDPKNAGLLVQVARIYESVHQFKDASGYYEQAVQADPKNLATRNELATCLYYSGDVDGAIAQLEQSVASDPKNANALFNLGMIRWQGKKDTAGAVTAWEQLLKSNPNLEEDKKAQVQKLIADAKQHSGLN